jgi:hypothetical protein
MPDEKKPPADDEAPQLTPLAALAKAAREQLGPEPDYATPAADSTLAAIVRDLKGMPELTVSREHKHRLRLGRRGKVGALGLEYRPNIRALELSFIGFPGSDPTTVKMHRYTFLADKGPKGEWHRMDEGGEFMEDVHAGISRLYPELAT